MSDDARRRIETRAVHAGRAPDPATGAVMPPLHLSTTFERDADGGYRRGFSYARDGHPNGEAVEACIASLEGGAEAIVYTAGMAASHALLENLPRGAHVVMTGDGYHGIRRQFAEMAADAGRAVTFADTTTPEGIEAAWRDETRMLWLETPSNPMLRITDLRGAAERAHARGATVVCDNTVPTPVLQRPLELGADVVLHSATKAMGGHSDLTGGALVFVERGALAAACRRFRSMAGSTLAPFDCWLLLRSLATLPVRVRTQTATAGQVAAALERHPAVAEVRYPGLACHPGHALAGTQMSGFGSLVSVRVAGGEASAIGVAAALRVFTRGTSLGGVESLVEHRASIEGPDSATPRDLLRLSIGLEHAADLVADLDQALARAA